MEWTKEFETGHERLDFEHRVMFDLINQFQNKIKQGEELENIELVVREIIQFAEHHFEWEEQLMVEIKFSGTATHMYLHKMLLASLKDMIQDLSFGYMQPGSLLQFLITWFTIHTSQEDKELVAHLGVQPR